MLEKWLEEARYVVVMTGAGMSTESGIPDFRSVDGYWKREGATRIASRRAMDEERETFVSFYRERMRRIQQVEPHVGYHVLRGWEKVGKLKAIITQNTDGLHQRINKTVIPIHGTIEQLHCDICKQKTSILAYFNQYYYCECGGFLRPSVILFGEEYDEECFAKAIKEARKSDLFIVLGSSLAVAPANRLPLLAKQAGARVVIVNHDRTVADGYADLIINDLKIGELLQNLSKNKEMEI